MRSPCEEIYLLWEKQVDLESRVAMIDEVLAILDGMTSHPRPDNLLVMPKRFVRARRYEGA